MAWSGFVRNALLALGIVAMSAPPVEAVEIVGGAQAPAQISDGWLTQVRNVRHGGGGARHGRSAPAGPSSRRRTPAGPPPRRRPSSARPPSAGPPSRPSPAGEPSGRPPAGASPRGRPAAGGRRRPPHRLGRPSGLVPVEPRRRDRSRRGDRLRHRCGGRKLGRRAAAAGPLLVLHRPEPPSGLLGRLPLRAGDWRRTSLATPAALARPAVPKGGAG